MYMYTRRLWNLHQRHKFLKAAASRVILSLRNGVSRGFQEVFSIADAINGVKDKLKVFMENRPCDMQNFDQ